VGVGKKLCSFMNNSFQAKFYIFGMFDEYMKTVEAKLENSQRWEKAQENLANFEEMMRLIRQYPIKPMQSSPPSPPYTIPEPYKY